MFLHLGVSNRLSENTEAEFDLTGGWDDIGLIYQPSIQHFDKMLDDPGYMDVVRRFKQGVLKDNPIMCCTEVNVRYKNGNQHANIWQLGLPLD